MLKCPSREPIRILPSHHNDSNFRSSLDRNEDTVEQTQQTALNGLYLIPSIRTTKSKPSSTTTAKKGKTKRKPSSTLLPHWQRSARAKRRRGKDETSDEDPERKRFKKASECGGAKKLLPSLLSWKKYTYTCMKQIFHTALVYRVRFILGTYLKWRKQKDNHGIESLPTSLAFTLPHASSLYQYQSAVAHTLYSASNFLFFRKIF